MNLHATWSITDEHGKLIAHGVHTFDVGAKGYLGAPAAIDPYAPALAIAQSVETALHNYLPREQCRIQSHDAGRAVSLSVSPQ